MQESHRGPVTLCIGEDDEQRKSAVTVTFWTPKWRSETLQVLACGFTPRQFHYYLQAPVVKGGYDPGNPRHAVYASPIVIFAADMHAQRLPVEVSVADVPNGLAVQDDDIPREALNQSLAECKESEELYASILLPLAVIDRQGYRGFTCQTLRRQV
ncbi:hypothetical protein PG984_002690 [Apiospora sp. TS-2023a]